MKKKGFTLIELLAVIVILAIIALIAIPLIGNVIEKAKIGALENSVNRLIESANMYYANQSIKGEQAIETIFDFANGEQTSIEKLEYKGKVYNGKLILHANGEVAVCIDDKEHYAYKNKDTDEIVSGIGECLYDGTTGDFSSNSSINDLRGKTVVATNITQSDDGLSTLITIPEEGHYDTSSKISVLNSDLSNKFPLQEIINVTSVSTGNNIIDNVNAKVGDVLIFATYQWSANRVITFPNNDATILYQSATVKHPSTYSYANVIVAKLTKDVTSLVYNSTASGGEIYLFVVNKQFSKCELVTSISTKDTFYYSWANTSAYSGGDRLIGACYRLGTYGSNGNLTYVRDYEIGKTLTNDLYNRSGSFLLQLS